MVDDHLGAIFRLDRQVFDASQDAGRIDLAQLAEFDHDRAAVLGGGDAAVEVTVDGVLDPGRGGEIGIAQGDADILNAREIELDLAFHAGAHGDLARGWHAFDHPRRLAFYCGTTGDDRPLGHGIDVAIRRLQRRHHQRPAQQALGIPDGGYADIDAAARPREGRQSRGHDNGGDVSGPQRLVGDVDAKPFQQACQQLLGKGGVAKAVAGAVQTHDQAITHQIVATHTVEIGQILDADRRGSRDRRQQRQDDHRQKAPHHK